MTRIMYEEDMRDAHIWLQHPTKTYLKFVKDHASNDFQAQRDEAEGDEVKYKFLRRQKCKEIKKRMRV